MTLSSDHRLIDGATAARFVNRVKAIVEDDGLWSVLTS
jgi:pyruvate/2-oxoglutarate dehydrogenase complex dihydrolipoamide acyltransferase (E2) component